jgi:hypothetical protein
MISMKIFQRNTTHNEPFIALMPTSIYVAISLAFLFAARVHAIDEV